MGSPLCGNSGEIRSCESGLTVTQSSDPSLTLKPISPPQRRREKSIADEMSDGNARLSSSHPDSSDPYNRYLIKA